MFRPSGGAKLVRGRPLPSGGFLGLGRLRLQVAHGAGHRLFLDGGYRRLRLLADRHVLVLATFQNQVEHLALDHLGGQCVQHVFLLQPGADAPGRFVLLLRQAVDLGVEILLADIDLFHLGDLLKDKMLLEGQRRRLEDVLLK
jgi:hypothetical protein